MTILLTVFLNADSMRNNKKMFERMISVSDSLKFDYAATISVMRALFGNSCIVQFSVRE